jgi:hypothetical protein
MLSAFIFSLRPVFLVTLLYAVRVFPTAIPFLFHAKRQVGAFWRAGKKSADMK